MDWNALHAKLAEHHAGAPQRAKLAEMAVQAAREDIGQLASLGHNYHLAEGPADPPQEWPKMVYHVHQEPRIVHHESELAELGPGWYDHPEKARTAEATAFQFAGRGGVGGAGLPALTGGPSAEELARNASTTGT